MDWTAYTDNLNRIGAVDYAVVALYILFILFYGLRKARDVRTSVDFLVAGRNLGLFVLIGTLVMTEFNTASAISWSQFGYRGGIWSLSLLVCFAIGLGSYTVLVAKRWKRLNAVSIAEMAEARFGRSMRYLVSFLVISSLCVYGPGYLKAASMVFSIGIGDYSMQYIAYTTTVLCVIVLAFTLLGGLISVAWTDLASFIITLVTLPVLFSVCFVRGNGLDGLAAVFPDRYLSLNPAGMWADPVLPASFVFATYMLLFLIYNQAPWYGQRMFAARNTGTAYRAMIAATIAVVACMGVFLGSAALAHAGFTREGFPDLPLIHQEKAIAIAIVHWMPPIIKGLMLSMIFAVCQTTLSSIWNVNVSMIVQDIYVGLVKPRAADSSVLKTSRIVTLFVALITIFLAVRGERIIDYLFFANIFSISLFFLTLGGFLWWKATRKATWIITLLSISVGLLTFLGKVNGHPEEGLQTVYFLGLKIYSGSIGSEPWLFVLCVMFMPVIVGIGILISLLDRESPEEIAGKVRFFDRCGAPLFGRRAYLRARDADLT